jgi:hypothetical protein
VTQDDRNKKLEERNIGQYRIVDIELTAEWRKDLNKISTQERLVDMAAHSLEKDMAAAADNNMVAVAVPHNLAADMLVDDNSNQELLAPDLRDFDDIVFAVHFLHRSLVCRKDMDRSCKKKQPTKFQQLKISKRIF